MLYLFIFIRL